jgi:CRISPR/Cas system-associated endonuclease Cas1
VKPDHFRSKGFAVLLTDDGRKLALELLERRFSVSVMLEGRGDPVSWRQAIGLSARALAAALKTKTAFKPPERG